MSFYPLCTRSCKIFSWLINFVARLAQLLVSYAVTFLITLKEVLPYLKGHVYYDYLYYIY